MNAVELGKDKWGQSIAQDWDNKELRPRYLYYYATNNTDDTDPTEIFNAAVSWGSCELDFVNNYAYDIQEIVGFFPELFCLNVFEPEEVLVITVNPEAEDRFITLALEQFAESQLHIFDATFGSAEFELEECPEDIFDNK